MATELLKVKKYEFSDGTILRVKIDFEHNKVSFLDKDGGVSKFKFAERGSEYMNGWLNILGAMRYVVREARDELEAWQKVQEEKKTQQIIDIMVALHEQEKAD